MDHLFSWHGPHGISLHQRAWALECAFKKDHWILGKSPDGNGWMWTLIPFFQNSSEGWKGCSCSCSSVCFVLERIAVLYMTLLASANSQPTQIAWFSTQLFTDSGLRMMIIWFYKDNWRESDPSIPSLRFAVVTSTWPSSTDFLMGNLV